MIQYHQFIHIIGHNLFIYYELR